MKSEAYLVNSLEAFLSLFFRVDVVCLGRACGLLPKDAFVGSDVEIHEHVTQLCHHIYVILDRAEEGRGRSIPGCSYSIQCIACIFPFFNLFPGQWNFLPSHSCLCRPEELYQQV